MTLLLLPSHSPTLALALAFALISTLALTSTLQGEVDTADLRISHRRPSVTGEVEGGELVVVPGRPLPAGGRLVQVELKVAHEGWLTKQSKTVRHTGLEP